MLGVLPQLGWEFKGWKGFLSGVEVGVVSKGGFCAFLVFIAFNVASCSLARQ